MIDGKDFLCLYNINKHNLTIHSGGKTPYGANKVDKFEKVDVDVSKAIEEGKTSEQILDLIDLESGKYVASFSKYYKDLTTSNNVVELLTNRNDG